MLRSLKRFSSHAKFLKNCRYIGPTNFSSIARPSVKYLKPFSIDFNAELKDGHNQFLTVYPEIVRELTQFASKFNDDIVLEHFIRAIEYNVPNGKYLRPSLLTMAFRNLCEDRQTTQQMHEAYILGWCIELLLSTNIISDDLIDNSTVRRNKPCWYMLDDVKLSSINDTIMIENGIYHILRRYFEKHPFYTDLVKLFHESAFFQCAGQSMDYHLARKGVDFFTMEKYRSLSDQKGSYLGFITPLTSAMILAGRNDREIIKQVESFCYEVGIFGLVQNDYYDFFGPDVLKKSGTDIEEGKCTWLAVTCMENGSDEQKRIMRECYGKNDFDCIQKVRKVYEEMDFPEKYNNFADEIVAVTGLRIQKIPCTITQNILHKVVDLLFNRK